MKRGRHPGPDVLPSRSAASALRSRRLVLEVARHHFGESARRVTERGGGLTNAVYELKTDDLAGAAKALGAAAGRFTPTKTMDYAGEPPVLQWYDAR